MLMWVCCSSQHHAWDSEHMSLNICSIGAVALPQIVSLALAIGTSFSHKKQVSGMRMPSSDYVDLSQDVNVLQGALCKVTECPVQLGNPIDLD